MKSTVPVLSLVLLLSGLVPSMAQEAPRRDLSNLEVFTEGFPRTLLFRTTYFERWYEDGVLDENLTRFNASTTKYAGEEGRYSPDLPRFMAEFKANHPRELCLVHINGEARTATNAVSHERYFPGHWVYLPGSILKQDLDAETTVIPVEDEALFSGARFSVRRGSDVTGKMLPSIILVPIGPDGEKRWYESEFAQITGTDPKQNTLTVDRGQYFSKARGFKAGETYIAPMHCEFWGGVMWTLNMSTACPQDKNGERAADVCVRELKAWCSPGGPAAHVDGIGFDVIYFLAKFPGWDLDNDGIAEDGIAPDGRRLMLEGAYAFLKRLRAEMGEDFLITSDGWNPKNQRAVGTFSGIESEGLCAPNDAWRMYATTLNSHVYWNTFNDAKHKYSYITAKMMHPEDAKIPQQLYRLGAATACALGVSYCAQENAGRKDGLPMIAEMHRGAAEETNWLGQPVTPMAVLPLTAPDLLDGAGKAPPASFVDQLQTERCSVVKTADGTLEIRGTSQNPYDTMEVTLPGIAVAEGDLSVFFEVKAIDPLEGFPKDDPIPRVVTLHAEGLPEYADQYGNRSMYNDAMAYLGTADFAPQCGYFRRAGDGPGTIDLTFVFEDQGACALRGLSLHNAPMAIVREFEHGVVLANASEENVVFDLTRLLPTLGGAQLRRIKANPEDYTDAPAVAASVAFNDGRAEDPARVTVPPRDGLFLEKAAARP